MKQFSRTRAKCSVIYDDTACGNDDILTWEQLFSADGKFEKFLISKSIMSIGLFLDLHNKNSTRLAKISDMANESSQMSL